MILRFAGSAAAMVLATLAVTPAHADVLEIGVAGDAHWIAGPAADAAATTGTELEEDVTASVDFVPETALARTDLQAQSVPQTYAAAVAAIAARYDLSPALIEAVVWQESRWRVNAVSPVGARGLAQLMPGTARDMGVNPDDPYANLEGGARYLRAQLDRFDGDIEKALAAYNAGPGRVASANGVPRIRETQNYVSSIMGRLSDHSRSSQ
ncbi:MAG: lytic transglycosylase domain-containing protein [Croceibacterium sp.]